MQLDVSSTSWTRVILLTIAGTLLSIAAAVLIDSYDLATGTWRWGEEPLNNVLIPAIIAPPLLLLLLRQMRRLALAHRELMTVASTDGLTQLLNRRAFTNLVDGYLSTLREGQSPHGTLLVIDVDYFKSVNDRFGHETGDAALQMVASAIRTKVRDRDLVARIGGEEFGVFLPGMSTPDAEILSERIRASIEAASLLVSGQTVEITASIGGVVFPQAEPFADLYRAADRQLYLAKSRGRNQVAFELLRAA
jgi:diguanylate cyclase